MMFELDSNWELFVALSRALKKSSGGGREPGGGLPYESDGDARRKIRINTLKETNLGVAPALFNP